LMSEVLAEARHCVSCARLDWLAHIWGGSPCGGGQVVERLHAWLLRVYCTDCAGCPDVTEGVPSTSSRAQAAAWPPDAAGVNSHESQA
jgi:hypothetical protein